VATGVLRDNRLSIDPHVTAVKCVQGKYLLIELLPITLIFNLFFSASMTYYFLHCFQPRICSREGQKIATD